MSKGEEKRAIFIGPKTISIGNILRDGKTVFFKRVPSKPFVDKWTPVMGNIDNVQKEVRKLYIPNRGETDMEVELYWCDLHLKEYAYQVPPEYISKIRHLEAENAMLKLKINRIMNMVYDSENEDLNRKRLKDDVEFVNKVKNPYGDGGSGPFMGSPFNRFN